VIRILIADDHEIVRRGLKQIMAEVPDISVAGEASNAPEALALVREQVAREEGLEGVVVVGGYDVVPSTRLDTLPADLREVVRRINEEDGLADPDDFVVWSDDGYGDRDDDLIPELPVSRVPDARSAELLFAALSADDRRRPNPRRGVRNVKRPFAEQMFALLPGDDPLLVSEPTTPRDAPSLDGDVVYVMLHGDFGDATRYWGETEAARTTLEAVNLLNVAAPGGRVVFAGCCWGGLVVDQPAARALPGVAPAPRDANASIALAFLRLGATAYVGCTGAHWSPFEPPFRSYAGPMHDAFLRGIVGGLAPAVALFQAKMEYARDFPHGLTEALGKALEYKMLREYTCLGLGW
jgi:hypothetical protein